MKKKKKKPIIFIFLVALVVLYALIYVIPKVSTVFVTSYVAEYGQLTISDETTGYLVRKETVYTSLKSGDINPYVEEGTLVRQNTKIMQVDEGQDGGISGKYAHILDGLGEKVVETKKYRSKKVGIVSYYADGYEQTLRPGNLNKLTLEDFEKVSNDNIVKLSRKTVNAGEPVYKIVDRTKWYVVCYVDLDHKDRYEKGAPVRVEFEDQTCQATVYKVSEENDKAKVVLKIGEYYENYSKIRKCNVNLVTYDDRGLLILNSSITEKDGKQGVYIKTNNDKFIFVPIQVFATNGEYSTIANGTFIDEAGEYQATVDLYDEVQKNP